MRPSHRIHVYKTGLMNRLLHNMLNGYPWYYSGTVPADRVMSFIAHLEEEYAVDASEDRRQYRRRRHGQANAFVQLHPSYTSPFFHWWLQLTDGTHPEPVPPSLLADARARGRHRLVVPGDFEAVLRPAPGGLPRWTWQLTSASYQNDAQRIRTVIRQPAGTDPINHLLRQIHGYPAFRGIRSQIAALRALALAEWRRTKAENVRLELPPFPPYLRYKHHPIVEIQIVLERLLRNEPPITWEERIRPLGPMLVPLKDHRAAYVTAEGRDDGR
jgi:hypothetical protein